jgi:hypothetical protein
MVCNWCIEANGPKEQYIYRGCSGLIRKIQYIVINYINLFVFDDEIEVKNRSTIQTLTFVQTNPDHLYMKLNMKLVVVQTDKT